MRGAHVVAQLPGGGECSACTLAVVVCAPGFDALKRCLNEFAPRLPVGTLPPCSPTDLGARCPRLSQPRAHLVSQARHAGGKAISLPDEFDQPPRQDFEPRDVLPWDPF